jgi:hypothetical protein
MEQKNNITSLQELIDWIENSGDFNVFDKEDDCFTIEAPNNATWQIQFEKDDDIREIIYKAIDQLEEFDADESFTEYWNFEFAKQNGFTPLSFITMLKKDEKGFRELADRLREFVN